MSKNKVYLESHGWRIFSRRKHGMYIKERWYHPDDGSVTFNQEEAMREQKLRNAAKKRHTLS